ncbi:MAG TPA: DUF370 domain-containing protein [Firmicutes bacterium]|nr:DUF370 domain-containing protein [Bacillota bacterium]
MFIHLGGDVAITDDDLVAVINADLIRKNASIAQCLTLATGEGTLKDLSNGMPKAVVITKKAVYLSPIAPSTLKKRTQEGYGAL